MNVSPELLLIISVGRHLVLVVTVVMIAAMPVVIRSMRRRPSALRY